MVKEWETTKDVTDLRSFSGLASYYRHYIRNFVLDLSWNRMATSLSIQKESLALVYGMKQFRHLLGRHFTVLTDHAPLQWLSSQKMEGLLARWALALQEYDFSFASTVMLIPCHREFPSLGTTVLPHPVVFLMTTC